jgi:outer membrane protein W
MKNSFLLYALILALVFNVYTYMFLSKEVTFEQEKYKRTTTRLKDSLQSITNKLSDNNYFSLEQNENAQNYFESAKTDKIRNHSVLIPFVTAQLLDFNANPKGNPYTGQDQIGANKFLINKVKVLNHRWIIADYSDGENWGEVLLKYFINEDETVSFEVNQTLLHQSH